MAEWKTKKYWGQEIKESPSGKTWRVFIRHAFWDKTVGINEKIINNACKRLNRRLEISVGNPPVTFIRPAWKIRLEGELYYRESKFEGGSPMKFYMIEIPRKKLKELDKAE